MANQSPDRRQLLEMLAKAAAASQFPGFSRWAYAYEPQAGSEASSTVRPAEYRPRFYTPAEYQMIVELTELIIPKDESPGAKEAGVSEFIDFMAVHGEEDLRKPMRSGLSWLDAQSRKAYGSEFLRLPADERTAILKTVAYRNGGAQPNREGGAFFQTIRRYTVMGYYTSRTGLQELDFPGLKFYTRSPECPHHDDPEHRHLPPARY